MSIIYNFIDSFNSMYLYFYILRFYLMSWHTRQIRFFFILKSSNDHQPQFYTFIEKYEDHVIKS